MAFTNIDTPGNRHQRRAVAAIQKLTGSAARKAAAQEKRIRQAEKRFVRDMERTIVFFHAPANGVHKDDPDGAYIRRGINDRTGQYQVIIVGKPKASVGHYVKAVAAFLKSDVRLIEDSELPLAPNSLSDRSFRSIIVEVV